MAADITTELWDAANTSKVADLSGDWARSWQDVANDAGTASLSIGNDNAQAAALTVGRHVRFKLGGDLAFTAVIGDGDSSRTLAGDGDDAAKVTEYRMRGIAAEWDDATVQPIAGNEPFSDRRPWTWASKEMPVGNWSTCYEYLSEISAQINLDPPYHEPWYPPRGWPEPLAAWLWPINRGNVYPPTRAFATRSFVNGADKAVTHFIAADGRARFFVNGIEVLGWTEQWPNQSFLDTYAVTVEMAAGTHRLGIEVEVYDGLTAIPNNARPPRGMFAWCAFEEDGTGVLDSNNRSGYTIASQWRGWEVAYQGGIVPAPNPHTILDTFLTEAQADGMLAGWSLSSTVNYDSGGNAWDTPIEYVSRVGDSGLDLLRQLSVASIDWRARPAGKVLDIWNKGDRGQTVTGAAIEADSDAYRIVRSQ